jgi:soluble lytic murein transglycosylase-like protein
MVIGFIFATAIVIDEVHDNNTQMILIEEISRLKNTTLIDNSLINAVIEVESGWNPNAIGPCGERGLMQICEPTWRDMTTMSWDWAFDSVHNRSVGTKYLFWIEKTIKSGLTIGETDYAGTEPTTELILAAYNGGIGRLAKNNWDISKMPQTTQKYVRKVCTLYNDN